MDLINGTDRIRQWYEERSLNYEFLESIENEALEDFQEKRREILIYK